MHTRRDRAQPPVRLHGNLVLEGVTLLLARIIVALTLVFLAPLGTLDPLLFGADHPTNVAEASITEVLSIGV
jgi:hypothetical protein